MHLEWVMDLIGGLLIGMAAAVYLLVNGRIMGASGIVGGLVDGSGRATAPERLSFVLGLFAFPALLHLVWGGVSTNVTGNAAVLVAAGLLVGIGTRIANGCTSGHGVCGIGRLSPRSIVATLTFMAAALIAVFVIRHVL